jgi:hypothetical protein
VIFVATKKVGQLIFFHLSFVAVVGSGIRGSGMVKIQDPGPGIKHPGSATMIDQYLNK